MAVVANTPGKAAKSRILTIDKVGFPLKFIATAALIVVAIMGTYRWYLVNYSFTVGLDYFEPQFQTYWMSLFYTQLAVIGTVTTAGLIGLWLTREKNLQDLPAVEELQRYFYVFGILSVVAGLFVIGLEVFAEADAAWHQVTVRDTDFTPTHIVLFYFIVPAFVGMLLMAALWLHTRLPDFANRVSLPMLLIVMGPALIMPNLGFNEWGHTFFYAEELFAAPVHWGFVVLGWAFFGITGLLVQCLRRVITLTKSPLVNK
jgi:methane/ammonia monooxygenase subunit C